MTTALNIPRKKASPAQRNIARKARLTEVAAETVTLQAQAEVIKRQIEANRTEAVQLLDAMQIKSLDLTGPNGEMLTVTRVQNSYDRLDEGTLSKLLGAKLWAKVTRRVLDTDLLKSAVALGDVDADHVAQATTSTLSKAFAKISSKGTPAEKTA